MRSIFWRLNSSFQHLVYAGNNFLSFQAKFTRKYQQRKIFPKRKGKMTDDNDSTIPYNFSFPRLPFELLPLFHPLMMFVRKWRHFEDEMMHTFEKCRDAHWLLQNTYGGCEFITPLHWWFNWTRGTTFPSSVRRKAYAWCVHVSWRGTAWVSWFPLG